MLNNKIGYRPTWAEINLNNLEHNFKQIKKKISHGVKVMVTVKADAYGHGLVPVAEKLETIGADYLGVASIDEGIKLREAGISLPILILGAMLKNDTSPLFEYKLTATVSSYEFAVSLNKKAQYLRKPLNVHIKVDTGMGRIGVIHSDAFEIVKNIYSLRFLNIEGIFTHFAFADTNKRFTACQIGLFDRLIGKLQRVKINIPLVHAANSAGTINYKHSHFNMVRPGLAIYGLYSGGVMKVDLKPVLSLKTRVVFTKRLPKGYGVSYGHTYITKQNTTIVILPIGYGDGYPRNLSNLAPVLIAKKKFKICGRVCMDQIMVDVGNASVKIQDEVVLIGCQGKNKITAEDLAGLAGTIPYEIVCGFGSRIPRVYT